MADPDWEYTGNYAGDPTTFGNEYTGPPITVTPPIPPDTEPGTGAPIAPAAGGAGGADLAKALQGLSKMGSAGAQQQQPFRQMQIPGATVGRPGAPVNLGTLLQMLMAKQNQYFPGAAQTQPVTMTRPTGLLGM